MRTLRIAAQLLLLNARFGLLLVRLSARLIWKTAAFLSAIAIGFVLGYRATRH